MKEITQLLGYLPPAVTDVLAQVASGNHAAVPDAAAQAAYVHVVPQLTQEEFQQAATGAFERLSPEERSQVADYLRTQGQQTGTDLRDLPSAATAATDPGALASATAALHAQGPNFLQQLLAPGGILSSPIAKAALLGITAMAAQRLTGRR
jgi:hypothetical protein